MKYISLFSGVGTRALASKDLGWATVCFSEIDPFASAVLAYRFPSVSNIGDILEHDWSQYAGKVDLVCGGPPCQAFSVAGLRNSLDDHRGNLSLEYVRAIELIQPRFTVTENVPGWLSTKDNAFGCFLGAIVGAAAPLVPGRGQRWTNAGLVVGPRRSAAWRVLDAQHWGVPQRRRRVFVVTTNIGDRISPDQILLKSESVCGNPAPSRAAREGSATGVRDGVAGRLGARERAGDFGYELDASGAFIPEVAGCLQERDAKGSDSDTKPGHLIPMLADPISANEGRTYTHEGTNNFRLHNVVPVAFTTKESGRDASFDVTPTLRAENGDPHMTGRMAIAFNCKQDGSDAGDIAPSTVTPPLSADADRGDQDTLVFAIQDGREIEKNQNGLGISDEGSAYTLDGTGAQAVAFAENQRGEVRTSDVAPSLNSGGRKPGEGYAAVFQPRIARNGHGIPSDIAASLNAHAGQGDSASVEGAAPQDVQRVRRTSALWRSLREALHATETRDTWADAKDEERMRPSAMVRRLTPKETERCQGYPDDWTKVPYNGKPASDGPRYRAIGNGWALPVVRWLFERIDQVEKLL